MSSLWIRGSGVAARRTVNALTPGIRTMATVTPRSAKTPDDPDALADNILPVRSLLDVIFFSVFKPGFFNIPMILMLTNLFGWYFEIFACTDSMGNGV